MQPLTCCRKAHVTYTWLYSSSPFCALPFIAFLLQSFLLTTCTLIHQIRNPFSSLILSRYVVTQTCITGEGAEKRKSEKTNLHNHKTSISKSQVLTASLGLVWVFTKALVIHVCSCDKYRFYWEKRQSSRQSKEKKCSKSVKLKGSGQKY